MKFNDILLPGILQDREVVELFLHYTVNPKPSVQFGDTPRCCLTGKEQVVSRFVLVCTSWHIISSPSCKTFKDIVLNAMYYLK